MSQSRQIPPVTPIEVIRKPTGHFPNFLQMIFEAVPFLRGFPFFGMGIVVFVFHGLNFIQLLAFCCRGKYESFLIHIYPVRKTRVSLPVRN